MADVASQPNLSPKFVRGETVVLRGHFIHGKYQPEQIKVAQRLPHVDVQILGI